MKKVTITSLILLLIFNNLQSLQPNQDQILAEKKAILRDQIGWATISAGSLCAATALAVSTGMFGMVKLVASIHGDHPSVVWEGLGLVATAASLAASGYCAWKVYKLQELKNHLK